MSTWSTAFWQGKLTLAEHVTAAATLLPAILELLHLKITQLQSGITFLMTDSMDWVLFFSACFGGPCNSKL